MQSYSDPNSSCLFNNNNSNNNPIIFVTDFLAGVTATLRGWSAFRTAVCNEWGGIRSKEYAENLRTRIIECFVECNVEGVINNNNGSNNNINHHTSFLKKPQITIENLEDAMFSYLEEEYSLVLEDNSEKEVSSLLFQMYEQCSKGDSTLAKQVVNDWRMANNSKESNSSNNNNGKVMVKTEGEMDEDSSDDDDDMDLCETAVVSENNSSTNGVVGVNGEYSNMLSSISTAEFASEYLFGTPNGIVETHEDGPVRQLGEAPPAKIQPELDDDGFAMVSTKRKGKN